MPNLLSTVVLQNEIVKDSAHAVTSLSNLQKNEVISSGLYRPTFS